MSYSNTLVLHFILTLLSFFSPWTAKGIKKTTPLLEELRRKKQENARKKAEDVKQIRTAKRAAARAAAAAASGGAIPGGATATAGANSKAEAKAARKAEKSKRKKDKKHDTEAGPAAVPAQAGAQAGPSKAAQKGTKPLGGKQKGASPAASKPKQPEAPPKMTILAPPRPAATTAATKPVTEKKDEQPKPTSSGTPAQSLAVGGAATVAKSAADQPAKAKPSLSSFDDIVGQFAKQMQSAPVKKSTPKPAADKAKQASSNGDKGDAKQKPSNSKGPKVTTPSEVAPSPGSAGVSEAGKGRGRGRGGQSGRGQGRKPSATDRKSVV